MSFKFCNQVDGEERTGCFTLTVFLMSCDSVLWLFLNEQWVSLRCVIVVSPNHTRFLFSFFFFLLKKNMWYTEQMGGWTGKGRAICHFSPAFFLCGMSLLGIGSLQ